MELRLRGLQNMPNAAERYLYELPHIQVNTPALHAPWCPTVSPSTGGKCTSPNNRDRWCDRVRHGVGWLLQMWTKLRPGVQDFLARAADCFELWIHTNGSRWATW